MSRVQIHNDTAKEEQETEKKKTRNGNASVLIKDILSMIKSIIHYGTEEKIKNLKGKGSMVMFH